MVWDYPNRAFVGWKTTLLRFVGRINPVKAVRELFAVALFALQFPFLMIPSNLRLASGFVCRYIPD